MLKNGVKGIITTIEAYKCHKLSCVDIIIDFSNDEPTCRSFGYSATGDVVKIHVIAEDSPLFRNLYNEVIDTNEFVAIVGREKIQHFCGSKNFVGYVAEIKLQSVQTGEFEQYYPVTGLNSVFMLTEFTDRSDFYFNNESIHVRGMDTPTKGEDCADIG